MVRQALIIRERTNIRARLCQPKSLRYSFMVSVLYFVNCFAVVVVELPCACALSVLIFTLREFFAGERVFHPFSVRFAVQERLFSYLVATFIHITDRVLFHVFHFVLPIVTDVAEGTDRNVKTHSEVDVPGQVEAEARSNDHRIDHGIKRVVVVLKTEFAGEFDEGIHPGEREPVNARTVDEHIGLTITRCQHETSMSVPTDGDVLLGEVQGELESRSHRKGVGRERMSNAFIVQIPRMTGTSTHGVFTRRDIEVEHGGKAEDALVAERHRSLEPEVKVATARGPHVQVAGRAFIVIGVVVVERKAHTDIQEVEKTDSGIEVTGEGPVPLV